MHLFRRPIECSNRYTRRIRLLQTGSCPLWKEGKTTQNENPKIEKKSSAYVVKQRVVVGAFRHAWFKSGLGFGLALFLHGVLASFPPYSLWLFCWFSRTFATAEDPLLVWFVSNWESSFGCSEIGWLICCTFEGNFITKTAWLINDTEIYHFICFQLHILIDDCLNDFSVLPTTLKIGVFTYLYQAILHCQACMTEYSDSGISQHLTELSNAIESIRQTFLRMHGMYFPTYKEYLSALIFAIFTSWGS